MATKARKRPESIETPKTKPVHIGTAIHDEMSDEAWKIRVSRRRFVEDALRVSIAAQKKARREKQNA